MEAKLADKLSRLLQERREKKRRLRVMINKERLEKKGQTLTSEDLLDPNDLEQLKALGYIK